MSGSSGLMDLRKFLFCFIIDVWINSKIYINVSELIQKYLQNLSSSLSKLSRRLWNSPRHSRLVLILCTQKRLFLVYKRLLHQILSINENTCTWFDILIVQTCQLHCFQFGSARLALWTVTHSAQSGLARLGLQCEWALKQTTGPLFWFWLLPLISTSYTYLLTPWCRVLEKLTGLQLVKFPAFYGTRKFVTALASFRHPSLSWASPIQSTYPHPTSWRSILILYASTLLTKFIHCIFLLRFLTIYIYYPNNFNLQTTMVYT